MPHSQTARRFPKMNVVDARARHAENVDMATRLPDPTTLPWPRRTARTALRPMTCDDATAMHAYRSLPDVCAHLSHGPLTLEQVEQCIEGRLSGPGPTPGRLVRGVAVELEERMVGDAMLRTQLATHGQPELWIGYALHRDNPASQRVLEKAGLTWIGAEIDDGQHVVHFARLSA